MRYTQIVVPLSEVKQIGGLSYPEATMLAIKSAMAKIQIFNVFMVFLSGSSEWL